MKNVIILGSGRSGTSMVAGTLAKAGYYMGEQLLPANKANPKGFFEDIEVNAINEDILSSVAPRRPKILGDIFFVTTPCLIKDGYWLFRKKNHPALRRQLTVE